MINCPPLTSGQFIPSEKPMDLELLKAILLGIVEGLTEFLPISSTGHLIVVGSLLDFHNEKGKVFEIVIQLGAILAVCWEYRKKIFKVVLGIPHESSAQRFAINILIAFLPAMVLGVLFHGIIKTYLFSPLTVACALIVGGFIILLIESKTRIPRIQHVEEMNWSDALKIGLAQSVAMFPGVSRSGATIMGGMIFGLSRTAATEFSFFLAIPTMTAATTYDLYKNWHLFSLSDIPLFAVGFIAAFISAFFAIKGLLHYVANHKFTVFAWYRIVFGIIVLIYFW